MKNKTAITLLIIFCISSHFSSAQNRFNNTLRLVYKTPPEELLTQREWILTATGFDDNNDAVLDASENTIGESDKGNSYFFNAEGICAVYDHSLSCDGSPVNQFNWKLLDNDTKLRVGSGHISILRLSENEMMLCPDVPGLKVKFIMLYRR